MHESLLRSLLSPVNSRDNLITRIRDNFRAAISPGKWKMTSAKGAPLYLLRLEGTPHAGPSTGRSIRDACGNNYGSGAYCYPFE